MKLYKKITPFLLITLVVVVSTIILWLPFILKQQFQYIYRQFDGLLYIIPAKTLYDINQINIPGKGFILSLPLSAGYFAAHLPLYPFFIRLFAFIFGYLKSMLLVNIIFTILLAYFFYYMLNKLKITLHPLILTVILLFLPRFLVVRSVGAPESLFIFLTIVSLYFFEDQKYWLAGIFGALSVMTKLPGILLFGAYLLVIIERFVIPAFSVIPAKAGIHNIPDKKFNLQWLWILLIPLGLLLVFGFYQIQFGDFFAFFHSGATIPMPYPFSVFNSQAKWVGTAWLEEIIFYFFMYILTAIYLYRSKYRSFFYFSLVFLLGTVFVQHRDISRYSLPLWPMAAIAYDQLFTSKKFLMACIIILPAIYLYAWNFLGYNVMPISDWNPFL